MEAYSIAHKACKVITVDIDTLIKGLEMHADHVVLLMLNTGRAAWAFDFIRDSPTLPYQVRQTIYISIYSAHTYNSVNYTSPLIVEVLVGSDKQ